VLVAFGASLAAPLDCALAVERRPTAPLRVAVYDVPPYGTVGSDGALSGLSVDLWRRVAEELEWEYRLTPVSQMETILSGLEQGRFDAAIGAITITPEREARIDFSYPTHRSGVAVALPKETGPLAAIVSYVTVAADLGTLIVGIFALLLLLGVVIWLIERPGRSGKPPHLARWPLLGGRYDDDRRLWRQDAEDSSWTARGCRLDVEQRRAGLIVVGKLGLAIDR